MTNGEKIKEIFPQAEITPEYVDMMLIGYNVGIDEESYFSDEWWNAEYIEPSNSEVPKNSPTETLISLDVYNEVARERNIAIQQLHELGYDFGQKIEPTTKNCESCEYYGSHHEMCNYCYKCSLWTEKEPTTKNDVPKNNVEKIEPVIRDNGVKDELNQVKDELEPTNKNDLSSELAKNSKKLEKNFGESDCISREQAQTEIEMNASRYTIAKERGGMGQVEWSDQLIKVSDAVDIIRHLPPVTPIRPKGHWITRPHVYGVAFCSECGFELKINNTNYCPNCSADMREVEE